MRVVQYIKRRKKKGLGKKEKNEDEQGTFSGELEQVPPQEVAGPIKQRQVRDVHVQKITKKAVNPLSNVGDVSESDIPEGHLLRCAGCGVIHFCEMAASRSAGAGSAAGGEIDEPGAECVGGAAAAEGGRDSDITEDLRGGTDEEEERQRSEGDVDDDADHNNPNVTVVKETKIDLAARFRPRGPDHKFCSAYVKALKKKLYDAQRARDLIRARYTEAKDDLFKTHKELDQWVNDVDNDVEKQEDDNLEELLQRYESLGRKLGARVPGVCTLPLHKSPFCNDPDHRDEFCNVPAHGGGGGERNKCGVPEHATRCPMDEDQVHCNNPEHAKKREECNVPAHRAACLKPLSQLHCNKPAHDDVEGEKAEMSRRLADSETKIATLREQTERCKQEIAAFNEDIRALLNEKNELQGQMHSVEREKAETDDAFFALSIWADEARKAMGGFKRQIEDRAEENEAKTKKLQSKEKELSDLRIHEEAVRRERDTLYQDKQELQEKLQRAEQRDRAGDGNGGTAPPEEVDRGGQRTGEERQNQGTTTAEERSASSGGDAFERLAFPAQAQAFAADLKKHISRLIRLTVVPAEAARYEILGNLRGFERRLEKIIDKETEYAADVGDADVLPYLHDFQLKARGAMLEAETRVKGLPLEGTPKMEESPPPATTGANEDAPYLSTSETAFGQAPDPGGAPAPSSAPSAATSGGGGGGGPPPPGWGGLGAGGGWGTGWFKGTSTSSAAPSSSAAAFEGDRAFYLALPPPWNQEPSGERITFSDYTKLLTSGYVKSFKEKLGDYPRFRTDFITNFHDARIPIIAKFKALANVGGPDMEATAEGVDAGQEGYGMMIRKLELLFGGKDRQMVALGDAIKECDIVRPGRVKEMQALVDAVAKYQTALPPERAHEGKSIQHAMAVMARLSEDLQLQFRQYCSHIGVEDEYNVPLLLRWLREHNIRHLYKRTDATKSAAHKKSNSGASGAAAAAAAASKAKAVFYVGGQQMEVVPVQDGGGGTGAAVMTQQAKNADRCWYCQDKHQLSDCPEFKSKPMATRKALVHGADLCAVCLCRGHYGVDCKQPRCDTCGGEHHSLVHGWGDGAARGGGRGRARGRGGRGRGRGGQQQQQAPADGAAGSSADGGTPDGASDSKATAASTDKKGGSNTAATLAAKAAATSTTPQAGEVLLYGDNNAQQSFRMSARFRPSAAAVSREASADSAGGSDPSGALPLWSNGINAFPRGSTFQFVSVATAVNPGVQSDKAFNAAGAALAASSSEKEAGEEGQISLRFAVVRIFNTETKANTLVNALLDDGATLTTISQRAAKVLGLRGKVEKLEVTGYGGNVTITDAVYCKSRIESRNGHFGKDGCLAVVPDPVGKLKAVDWSKHKARWPHLQGLPIEGPLGDGQVDMILGVDQSLFHQALDERRGRSSAEPCARLTPAGWTVVGWTHADGGATTQVVLKASSYDTVGLRGCSAPSLSWPSSADKNRLIAEHAGAIVDVADPAKAGDGADLEQMAGPLQERKTGVFVNAGDRQAVASILQNWKQTDTGRVILPPLWKTNERPPPNFHAALTQWHSTERALVRQGVRMEYDAAISKWMGDGHAEWIDPNDKGGFFIPHFPVIRRDKSTTKVRVVANGRAVFRGRSLNDFMVSGPKVVNSLVQVLLRFRRYPQAIIVDVESMFLRVGMPAEDRRYHRFIYTDPTTGDLKPFQTVGHVFGSTGSPCIAIAALKIGACRLEGEYPLAAESILHSSMVDDVVDSVKTVEDGKQLSAGLSAVAASLDMRLHKWCASNSDMLPDGAKVVTSAHIEDKAGIKQEGDGGEEAAGEHKPLGLIWTAASDQMKFQYRPYDGQELTKLGLLKLYMALFDPLGLIMPFIMSARILYRDLWRLGCDWDEPVPEDVARQWKKWMAELELLDEFSFPRCIHWEDGGFLAAFSDASKDAYGAAVYLVGKEHTRLLYARGRVNSQEGRTIPLLELLGAELAVVAAREAARALDLPLSEVEFFCDSQTALNWLRRPARDVSNHVARKLGQLREAVPPEKWSFVPTDLNPADVLSRGCSMHELQHHELWWEGPAFLRLPKDEWPAHGIPAEDHPPVPSEVALTRLIGIYAAQGRPLPPRHSSPFKDFSSWLKVIAAIRALRAAARRWKEKKGGREVGAIDEEVTAVEVAIRLEQSAMWPDELQIVTQKGELPPRHPWSKLKVIGSNGIMQAQGRSVNDRAPVLSKDSWLAKLWIRHVHEIDLRHAGGQKALLSESQKRVWIVGGAVLVRQVLRACIPCKKQQPVPFRQPEAPLPSFRTGSAEGQTIFSHVLVDECGPFLTRQGRGRPAQKRWIFVITCGATRAVHLELLPDRTAEEVSAAMVRFACRHTVPKKVVSDNAPEFSAAADLLKRGAERAMVGGGTEWERTKWQHYPPYAPNFGGAVEAMVKLTKRTLSKVVKDKEHTDLDLAHCIKYVEFILNSRPLSAVPDQPGDPAPISANTFLRDLGQLVEVSDPLGGDLLRSGSAALRSAVEQTWDELRKEIRAQAQPLHRAVGGAAQVKVGDIVVALDVPPPPGQAVSIGRIDTLWAGSDGLPRRADVRVRGKVYHRALKSLAPLYSPLGRGEGESDSEE